MQPEALAQITAALKELRSNAAAFPFLTPVDWKALGLNDYPSIVSQPMDLRTVGKKLRSGAYHDAGAFWSDVELIWSNCLLFNEEKAEVSKLALAMRKKTRELKRKMGEPEIPTIGISRNIEVPAQVEKFCRRFCQLSSSDAATVVRFLGLTQSACFSPFGKRHGTRQFELDLGCLYTEHLKDFNTAHILVKKLLQAANVNRDSSSTAV